MQTLKVEIFDEDVADYNIEELAEQISDAYCYDSYKGAHVKVTNETTGESYDYNPHMKDLLFKEYDHCTKQRNVGKW